MPLGHCKSLRPQNINSKQVKQVYNDQPLGILALAKVGGGYGSLVSMVSRVPGYLGGVLWYLG